ncbi:MAG: Trp biosynthesis-associated membrane protein [Actinomycetia bacterium]|nr:Trp biosynthesis-associated membrane protein [Actinomycetes bacterium]
MSALTRRPAAILIAGVAALLAPILARQPWVRGTVDDAMIGGSLQQASGDEAVTGFVALGLVILAGTVAAAATRRLGRRVSAVLIALSSLGLGALVMRVILDPGGILGANAAAATGRTGTLTATGEATTSAYLALLPALLGLVCAVLAWRGARHWPEPSSAYDRPDSERPGRRGERVSSDWDRLSEGEDPTSDPTNDTSPTPRPPASSPD